MGDLPSKFDRLLEILEIVAQEKTITLNNLAKYLGTKISSIGIYIDYLEEFGLIHVEHDGKRTLIHIVDNTLTRIYGTTIAVYRGQVIVFRCPFKGVCEYYEKGCPSVDKCIFLQSFLPAIEEAIQQKTLPRSSAQYSEEQ